MTNWRKARECWEAMREICASAFTAALLTPIRWWRATPARETTMAIPSSTLPELSVVRNGALVAWMYAATSARIGRYRWARTQLSEPPGRCFLRNGMRLRATKAMPGPAKKRNVRTPSPMMNRFVVVAPARAPWSPNSPPQPRAMIRTEPMMTIRFHVFDLIVNKPAAPRLRAICAPQGRPRTWHRCTFLGGAWAHATIGRVTGRER